MSLDNDEKRLGLLCHIFKNLENKYYYFGRIIIQKIVYFLQHHYNVKFPYAFTFYHYGPYSRELDSDLATMDIYGLIELGADPKGRGHSVTPKPEKMITYLQKASDVVSENEEKISDAVAKLAGSTPRLLELWATIHWVKSTRLPSATMDEKQKRLLFEKVRSLKPSFTLKQIESSYEKLVERELI
jgi:uncharacterized protein YwgA